MRPAGASPSGARGGGLARRTRNARARGSKASLTALAKNCIDSTSVTMKPNAVARVHQTTGSRDISLRALLIIVPKLFVLGSTPTPTYESTAS